MAAPAARPPAAAAAAAPAAAPDADMSPDTIPDRFADMTINDDYAGPKYGFISLEDAVRERDRMEQESNRMSDKCDLTLRGMQDAYEAADRWQRRADRARAALAHAPIL